MSNDYKIKLEEEKKLLEVELGDLGKIDEAGGWEATPEEESTVSQEVQDDGDMAERSEDYEERSMKLEKLGDRLLNINKALEKIENGGYGICEICGKEIEKDRLEVNPAAPTCKECMEKVI